MSVNRCIAIASHGRRCQQSTYRGGPYCWHHTQSRKVWPPSRVGRATPAAARDPEVSVLRHAVPAIDRVAARLDEPHLRALAEFLESTTTGTFRIDIDDGDVAWAGRERLLPYPRRRRTA